MLIFLVLIVAVSSSFLWYRRWLDEKKLNERLKHAVDFLLIQYTPFLNFCCESPVYFPNRYWLVSDNLWAYAALENYYPNISHTIKIRLHELAETYNLPRNKDGLPISYKHEAVIGDTVPIPFNVSILYTLKNYTLEELSPHPFLSLGTEIANSTTAIEDWENYTDLLLYASLSRYWEGNETGATALFNEAKEMWDGKGLNDTVTKANKTYSTYKLALLLYASRVLNQPFPFKSELESTLWSMQRESDGGIITDYNYTDNSIIQIGDANTETTSLTIIAYTYFP